MRALPLCLGVEKPDRYDPVIGGLEKVGHGLDVEDEDVLERATGVICSFGYSGPPL